MELENQEHQNSVKFGINAKCQWSAEVKCYDKSLDLAYSQALAYSEKAETQIKKKNGVIKE